MLLDWNKTAELDVAYLIAALLAVLWIFLGLLGACRLMTIEGSPLRLALVAFVTVAVFTGMSSTIFLVPAAIPVSLTVSGILLMALTDLQHFKQASVVTLVALAVASIGVLLVNPFAISQLERAGLIDLGDGEGPVVQADFEDEAEMLLNELEQTLQRSTEAAPPQVPPDEDVAEAARETEESTSETPSDPKLELVTVPEWPVPVEALSPQWADNLRMHRRLSGGTVAFSATAPAGWAIAEHPTGFTTGTDGVAVAFDGDFQVVPRKALSESMIWHVLQGYPALSLSGCTTTTIDGREWTRADFADEGAGRLILFTSASSVGSYRILVEGSAESLRESGDALRSIIFGFEFPADNVVAEGSGANSVRVVPPSGTGESDSAREDSDPPAM